MYVYVQVGVHWQEEVGMGIKRHCFAIYGISSLLLKEIMFRNYDSFYGCAGTPGTIASNTNSIN